MLKDRWFQACWVGTYSASLLSTVVLRGLRGYQRRMNSQQVVGVQSAAKLRSSCCVRSGVASGGWLCVEYVVESH